jgi:hypothetical protein
MSSYDSIKITYCLIRVKSNGLIEQWKTIWGGASEFSTSFNVRFTTTNYMIVLLPKYEGGSFTSGGEWYYNVYTDSCSFITPFTADNKCFFIGY